jgi:hypothetical protein
MLSSFHQVIQVRSTICQQQLLQHGSNYSPGLHSLNSVKHQLCDMVGKCTTESFGCAGLPVSKSTAEKNTFYRGGTPLYAIVQHL